MSNIPIVLFHKIPLSCAQRSNAYMFFRKMYNLSEDVPGLMRMSLGRAFPVLPHVMKGKLNKERVADIHSIRQFCLLHRLHQPISILPIDYVSSNIYTFP